MPRSVVFQTDGRIDIRAITVFGMNAKPNAIGTAIGRFGTGLKYAIATILRKGCQVELWIGADRHVFYTKSTHFRSEAFEQVRMKSEERSFTFWKPKYIELPFTTELGKDWELWQAFRELESNTRDEGGLTFMIDQDKFEPSHQETHIVVTGDDFVEEYLNIDKTFLPNAMTQREASERLEVLDRGNKFVYYRGLRVLELEKPTVFTYNFLSYVSLTEDRTMKYQWEVDTEVINHVLHSKDEELIRKVVEASEDNYEHSLKWNYVNTTPSDAFMRVMARSRRATSGARSYYSGYAPSDEPLKVNPLDNHPGIWDAKDEEPTSDGLIQLRLEDENEKQVCIMLGDPEVLQAIIDLLNKARKNGVKDDG